MSNKIVWNGFPISDEWKKEADKKKEMDKHRKKYFLNQFLGFLQSGNNWDVLDSIFNRVWSKNQDEEIRAEIARILTEHLKKDDEGVF